jgi:hypothetical protein
MLLAKLSSRWSHAPGERQNHPDLGYVVQLQKCDVLLAGSEEMVRSTLRVTMVFRREDGTWRVAHATRTQSRRRNRSTHASTRRYRSTPDQRGTPASSRPCGIRRRPLEGYLVKPVDVLEFVNTIQRRGVARMAET